MDWIEEAFQEAELASQKLLSEELKTPPSGDLVRNMIHQASLRKLREDLDAAIARADMAALIKQVISSHRRGEIHITIPDMVTKDGYGFKYDKSWGM